MKRIKKLLIDKVPDAEQRLDLNLLFIAIVIAVLGLLGGCALALNHGK